MGATKPWPAEVTEASKRGLVMGAKGCLRDSKEFLQKAPEVLCPDLRELRCVRVDAQEPPNSFAYLLNCGSSLE